MRHVYIGLPAFNEEVALPRVLARVQQLVAETATAVTVVVYDDGSSDSTAQIARSWRDGFELVLIEGGTNLGLGAGLSRLIEYVAARGADDDALVVMDCDDTHDPMQIVALLQEMDAGNDVVVASRYRRGAAVIGVPLFRRITALGAAALFKMIHPVANVWDYTCGYRLYRVGALKKAMAAFAGALVQERGFSCMAELLLKLNAAGVKFNEIPLQLRYDQKPTDSKMIVGSNARRLLILLVKWRYSGFDSRS